MGDTERKAQKAVGGGNGFVKGNKMYHAHQGHKYNLKLNTSKTTTVNIIDKTARSAKGKPGDWVLRFDKPHRGAEFNHININPKLNTKLASDPHVKLPPGAMEAGVGTAKFCKVVNKVNKVAVPLAIAVDVVQTGVAVYHDVDNGTSRNTMETAAGIAGGWGGGYGGAVGGAAIGTAIFPGIGTIIGGIIGGIAGGIGGSIAATSAVETIGDACDYDIVERKCKKCKRWFKARQYLGEKYCDKCSS